jgi:transposase
MFNLNLKVMHFNFYLGIDVSKEKVDVCLHQNQHVLFWEECDNNEKSLTKLLRSLQAEYSLSEDNLLVCAEHTGMYSHPLHRVCSKLQLSLWLENPATIKHSGGLLRGKNDKIDAERIAIYAFRFQDKVQLTEPYDPVMAQLKYLHSERKLLVRDQGKYKGQLKDQSKFLIKEVFDKKKKRLQAIILTLSKQIAKVEEEIHRIIEENKSLKFLMNLMTSIKGVGPQLALYVLLSTEAFKRFVDPKKYCCHAGVAPFRYQSGSSQRSPARVSHKADKEAKCLLHMSAMSAIQHNHELKAYFDRKTKAGKKKMTVINAVRSKLVHRIFAVVRDNRKYEYSYAPSVV